MNDREKVIKGLETCSDVYYGADGACSSCPYSQTNGDRCLAELVHDTIALLKEQEAVEPKQVDLYGNDEWWGLVCICPDCNAEWMTDKANTHFCPNCGRSVKWE